MSFHDIKTLMSELRERGDAAAARWLEIAAEGRARLPPRRDGESFDFEFQGTYFTATIGFYEDGQPGELFLNGLKLDTMQDVYACDLGKAISIALQHGASLETLAHTMTRDAEGRPRGLAGHVLDLIGGMA